MVAINEQLRPGAGPQSLPAGDYYLLQDTLYRVAALTNSSGNIVEAYDCDAYGNTLIFTAADPSGNWWGDSATQSNFGANDIIYCGYRLDPETENYYVRNRYYSPTLGRWLTRDPIGYAGGMNLYEYVGSSPTANLDASGLQGWGPPPWGTSYTPPPTSLEGTGLYDTGNQVVPMPGTATSNGVQYASLGLEITAGAGGSLQVGYAWDECGNHCWYVSPSGRLGLSLGAGFSRGGSAGCLSAFLDPGQNGWDLGLGAGPFVATVSGTSSGGLAPTSVTGGSVGASLGVFALGASYGFADVAAPILILPCVLSRPCPCREERCPKGGRRAGASAPGQGAGASMSKMYSSPYTYYN